MKAVSRQIKRQHFLKDERECLSKSTLKKNKLGFLANFRHTLNSVNLHLFWHGSDESVQPTGRRRDDDCVYFGCVFLFKVQDQDIYTTGCVTFLLSFLALQCSGALRLCIPQQ